MNLNNFENYIDGKILSRGWEYFKDGSITSLEQDDGIWYAEVEGSETYTVTAIVSKSGDILDTDCDCPYDYGDYCKHQAAVFYALQNIPEEKRTQPKTQKKDLRSALSELSRDGLVDILMEYAGNNRKMKKELELRFSDSRDIFEKSRSLIRLSVQSASRGGFVEYGYTSQAVEGAEKVLNTVEDMIGTKDVEATVKLLFIVLEEMMELLGDCDDSNGEVGGVIDSALTMFGETISCAESGLTSELFQTVTGHVRSGIYNGWDSWGLNILESCVPFCADKKLREELESVLDTYSKDRYEGHAAQNIRLQIISIYDGEDAAEAFMENHLENDRFRKALIEKAIERNKLDYALKLCQNGEETDAKYPGLVGQWRKQAYTVYELMNDKPSQITLSRAFILDGDFEYYKKFKKLHSAEQWPDVLDKLLADIENNRYGIYIRVLVEEDLKPRILEFCRKNPHTLPDLSKHLVPDYKQEIQPLFEALITKQSAGASDRKRYQDVCEVIKTFRKCCGKAAAASVISELLELNKRRPAFVDELRKISK